MTTLIWDVDCTYFSAIGIKAIARAFGALFALKFHVARHTLRIALLSLPSSSQLKSLIVQARKVLPTG